MIFKNIHIVGMGLIGGSLAKSIRKHYPQCSITGVDPDKYTLETALANGVINQAVSHLNEDIKSAELVFLCAPVAALPSLMQEVASLVSSRTIITDTGSTKQEIMDIAQKVFDKATFFVGGHPMAGTQYSGYPAALPHLFENAYYILTPALSTPQWVIEKLKVLLSSIGAIPLTMEAQSHDRIVGAVSHLPHVVAAALVNSISKLEDTDHLCEKLAAGGFRDITRIASSNPEMWTSISFSNRYELLRLIVLMINELEGFSGFLEEDNHPGIRDFYALAKSYRENLPTRQSLTLLPYHDLYVDVEDRPGVIGEVATYLGKYSINIKNLRIINSREGEPGCLVISLVDPSSLEKARKVLLRQGYHTFIK